MPKVEPPVPPIVRLRLRDPSEGEGEGESPSLDIDIGPAIDKKSLVTSPVQSIFAYELTEL